MATFRTPQSNPRYYVTHEGQVRGPFDLTMIEAMVLLFARMGRRNGFPLVTKSSRLI